MSASLIYSSNSSRLAVSLGSKLSCLTRPVVSTSILYSQKINNENNNNNKSLNFLAASFTTSTTTTAAPATLYGSFYGSNLLSFQSPLFVLTHSTPCRFYAKSNKNDKGMCCNFLLFFF